MNLIQCSIELEGEDVLIDVQGGTEAERLALMRRTGEWARENKALLGTADFRLIAGDNDDDFVGACISVDTESHCAECASKNAAKWLREQGLEVAA